MDHQLPEKFSEFSEAGRAGFLRVKQVKEDGGKVAGIFCTFTPVEILDAAGFTAVSLCGMSDNKKRMELLPRLVKEYQAGGIIEVDLQACTPYGVEAHQIRRLAEGLGVPYLSVETDYSQSDSGQLSTRIEAFLEMI